MPRVEDVRERRERNKEAMCLNSAGKRRQQAVITSPSCRDLFLTFALSQEPGEFCCFSINDKPFTYFGTMSTKLEFSQKMEEADVVAVGCV